jgi:hypothetical protein
MRRDIRAVLATVGATVTALGGITIAQASVQDSSVACARPDGRVRTSVVDGGVLYLGGSFTHVTDLQGVSQPRARLAAIDMGTCDVLPWAPQANGDVYALTAAGGTVYAGGDFTTVGTTSRTRLVALDSATGGVLPFAANMNNRVWTLAISGDHLYAGGSFGKVNGLSRAKLAAFNSTTGTLTGWRPTATGTVRTLTPSADGLQFYVGGAFTALNGDTARRYIGSLDRATGGLASGFSPRVAFPILDIAADTAGVYAAGAGSGGHLALFNLDGSLQRPVYQTDGDVQAIAVDTGSVYAAGHFDNYCVDNTGSGAPFICDTPLPRSKVYEVSLQSGGLTSWAPTLNSNLGVFTATVDPLTGSLWVGGDFTTINTTPQPHLGVFRTA